MNIFGLKTHFWAQNVKNIKINRPKMKKYEFWWLKWDKTVLIKYFLEIYSLEGLKCKILCIMGQKWIFRPNKSPICEIFKFEGLKLYFSIKQGTTSAPSPFQGLKILFIFKKDQRCKNFLFWAKSVKVAKNEVSAEKTSFWGTKTVFQTNLSWKIPFQQVLILKCQEKWFKD